MFLEKDSLRHLFWIIEKNKVKYRITYFVDFIKPVVLQAVPPARILPFIPEAEHVLMREISSTVNLKH